MLVSSFTNKYIEAGCDEAGRGCLAGPVFAAAVILPLNWNHALLNDSKVLSVFQRNKLRRIIEKEAISWSVQRVDPQQIDDINILQSSILAMHQSLENLSVQPELILVDGNYFLPYNFIPYHCIIKGDGKYASIAAASILAKTHRDQYMENLHRSYPSFNWSKNKGYPTKEHRQMIFEYGTTKYHRLSFKYSIPGAI